MEFGLHRKETDWAEKLNKIQDERDAAVAQERVRLGESQDREQDRTALHDACHRDDVSAELVESLLMKYPAIGTCYDIHGCTALHVLMEREKVRGPPPNPNLKEVPLQGTKVVPAHVQLGQEAVETFTATTCLGRDEAIRTLTKVTAECLSMAELRAFQAGPPGPPSPRAGPPG